VRTRRPIVGGAGAASAGTRGAAPPADDGAEALFYGFGIIGERARRAAKPHHRHQTCSAAAAAVGATGRFTHGKRAGTV